MRSRNDGERGSCDGDAAVVCKWTCPFCGKSRAATDDSPESGRRRAAAGLRAHVYNSVGNGHGPRRAFPEAFERAADHLAVAADD